jgi:hypothetical protein
VGSVYELMVITCLFGAIFEGDSESDLGISGPDALDVHGAAGVLRDAQELNLQLSYLGLLSDEEREGFVE